MQLLDLLFELGSWSIEEFWIPLLAWTAIALPLLLVVRYGSSVAPHVRYRAALSALVALPLGLLASALISLEAPAIREVAAIVVLPEIEAIAQQGSAVASLWTVYHTAGLGVLLAIVFAGWRLLAVGIAAGQLIRYRNAVDADTPQWLSTSARRLQQELGLRRDVRVGVCEAVVSPLTFGSQRPLILLPSRLLDSPEDLHLVLVHEMIHIRRRDFAVQWLEQILGAVFFIHPLVTLYRREIDVLREITCDADVLAHSGNRPRYARLLYQYAAPPAPQLDMAVGIVFRQHDLSERIRSMKDYLNLTQLERSKRVGILVSVTLLAVAMVVVACSDVLVQPTPGGDQAPVVGQGAADAETFVIVEDMPQLIGGLAAVQQNLVYPALAKKAGIEGRVIVQFVVDEEGAVVDPVVVKGIGSGLDEAALSAVKSVRFEPGMQDGEPVKVKMSLPITFKLDTNLQLSGDGSDPSIETRKYNGCEGCEFLDEIPSLVGGLEAIAEHVHYSPLAKEAGVEGIVIVEFIVDEQGNVVDPNVVRGLGSGLDEAAIQAVREVRFTPGKRDGRPVRVKMALPITFKLE